MTGPARRSAYRTGWCPRRSGRSVATTCGNVRHVGALSAGEHYMQVSRVVGAQQLRADANHLRGLYQ